VATVRDIALDASGDLSVVNGDLATTGFDAGGIAQDIDQALSMFNGEDPVSPSEGTPWFQNVLGKNPNPNVLRQMFTDVITARPGVEKVASLNMNYDHARRQLAVDFKVEGDADQLIASTTTIQVP
jgi:hypothetical protein